MATNNSVNSPLSGTSGTGNFTGNNSPSLTTPKINQINDPNNNPMAYMYAVPSAVNYMQFVNATTGDSPQITAIGSDANIQLKLAGKGTGTVNIFGTANGTPSMTVQSGPSAQHVTQFQFPATAAGQTVTYPDLTGTVALSGASQNVSFNTIQAVQINDNNNNASIALGAAASAVNYLTVTNAPTGNPVQISANGTDTNIPLYIAAKGSTQVRLGNDLLMYNTAGGNNYTVITTTASGAKTVTIPNATGTIQLQQSSPTIQKFTSGSGTYTTPAGVKYIVVQMCGGGGGGSAASTGTPTAGGAGGNTTFGSSLLTANGGAAPVGGTGAVSGGLGGSFTLNSPAIGQGFNGGDGGAGAYLSGTTGDNAGGSGGSNPFGGSPTGGKSNTAGTAGYANTGAGGSGGGIGATGTATAGAGGGAGGYIYAIINSPSATYSYSVGTGGTAGTGSYNGGAGAAGIIIVTEYYQ